MSESAGTDRVGSWVSDAIASSRLPDDYPDLSDAAAVLIASGFVADDPRAVLVRRLSDGLPVPGVGGYAELRRLQLEIQSCEDLLAKPSVPQVASVVIKARMNGLVRRREAAARMVAGGKQVFAGSIRGVRRERKEGIHLAVEDRERLFHGLLFTPAPRRSDDGFVSRITGFASKMATGAASSLASRERATAAEKWIAQWGKDVQSRPQVMGCEFADSYEALLFLAGTLYDQISASSAWQSEHFALQRSQMNLHAELASIATDAIALRGVRIELDQVRNSPMTHRTVVEQIEMRERALRPVWAQLIGRVQTLAALLEAVTNAEGELKAINDVQYTASVDSRIDHLVSRTGEREFAQDNTQLVTEQVRAGQEQLRAYREILQNTPPAIEVSSPRRLE